MNEIEFFRKLSLGQGLEEIVDVPPEFVLPLPPLNVPERELSRYAFWTQRNELVESR